MKKNHRWYRTLEKREFECDIQGCHRKISYLVPFGAHIRSLVLCKYHETKFPIYGKIKIENSLFEDHQITCNLKFPLPECDGYKIKQRMSEYGKIAVKTKIDNNIDVISYLEKIESKVSALADKYGVKTKGGS